LVRSMYEMKTAAEHRKTTVCQDFHRQRVSIVLVR
jgi:hypothetical protein